MTLSNACTTDRASLSPGDGSQRYCSRSPHPYNRQSISVTEGDVDQVVGRLTHDEASESSTERGTEADDEKGPILRALPAPPLKARKGWRGSKSPLDLTPAVTPVLSRNASEEILASFSLKKKAHGRSEQDKSLSAQVDVDNYGRYIARRRAEVVRRVTETVLLLAIVALTCGNSSHPGNIRQWSHEIFVTGTILGILYASYPVRRVLLFSRNGLSIKSAVKRGFHVPSRFDPGPLLYPVLIPFCIAVSLADLQKFVILVNLLLGLASVPEAITPRILSLQPSLLRWVLCILAQGKNRTIPTSVSSPSTEGQLSLLQLRLNLENLTLLVPLHETLVAIINYLTTTSLDPAELQLLSSGLINLLLFAISPQAQILRAIIWIGSLCLFVTCRKTLAWEVTLARVPTWKFARNKSPKRGLLGKLEGLIYLILPLSQQRRQGLQLDSDDEDYDYLRSARKRPRIHSKALEIKVDGILPDVDAPISLSPGDSLDTGSGGLARSVTLPDQRILPLSRKPSVASARTGFLALTYAQAQGLKWILAAYIYTATAFVIMIVLRPCIALSALHSHEPFGWAIGYLFGNIPPLRFWIVSQNLERWIALPPHPAQLTSTLLPGWIERYRQMNQGAANVRLFLAGYCILVLLFGLLVVLRLGVVVEVDTRRKVFHGIMVAMLLPTVPIDPCFVALALTIILAIFMLLDLFRASQVPPISKPLTTFLAPYVDGRDHRGPVIISHIFLLIGCAVPLWLALAGTSRSGPEPWTGWDATTRDLSMISGVVCVGMGDAAASLIGRRYGRTKWFWGGGKSIEGSCAFAGAVTVGLMASYLWLRIGGWVAWDTHAIPQATVKALIAASGASLLESVLTAANDNVVVPVGLWLLVRGLSL